MNELIKKAKEIYLLSGVVYIFDDGNIYNNIEGARLHAMDRGIDFKEVILDDYPENQEPKVEIQKPKKR